MIPLIVWTFSISIDGNEFSLGSTFFSLADVFFDFDLGLFLLIKGVPFFGFAFLAEVFEFVERVARVDPLAELLFL